MAMDTSLELQPQRPSEEFSSAICWGNLKVTINCRKLGQSRVRIRATQKVRRVRSYVRRVAYISPAKVKAYGRPVCPSAQGVQCVRPLVATH